MLWTEFITGGSGHQLFLFMPNLRPKNFLEFFRLQSALESEFLRVVVWAPTFIVMPNLRQKIFLQFFSFTENSGLNFLEGGS